MSEVEREIDELVARRSDLWRRGLPAGDVSLRLEAAYDKLRRERAARSHGSQDEILSRARVERELEKLGG